MIKLVKITDNPHSDYIYIGRPSIYGNPYSSKKQSIAEYSVETKNEALLGYREYLLSNPKLLRDVEALRGKTITCWCVDSDEYKSGDKIICHGQILQMYLQNPDLLEEETFKTLLLKGRAFNSLF